MADHAKNRPIYVTALLQIGAGGSAGFVEVCIMHPLDLIKTRFQIQTVGSASPYQYNSIMDCFRTMYRTEGPLSFYRGIFPPILAETPKRATKFVTFEQYKGLFCGIDGMPQWMGLSMAGLGAGLTEAVVVNPFEVVKVKLQAEQTKFSDQSGTWATARQIVRQDGFGSRGLNKGLTSTLGRNGVWNMIYFGFYHNMRNLIPASKDSRLEFLRRLFLSLCAGSIASVVNIPFDVAKSRIQGPQPVKGQIKYKTCFQSMGIVYREEGFRALYKGLVPKLLRLGPGGAIMMLVYEHVYEYLSSRL